MCTVYRAELQPRVLSVCILARSHGGGLGQLLPHLFFAPVPQQKKIQQTTLFKLRLTTCLV